MGCEKCGRLSPMSNPDAACAYCGHIPAVGAVGGVSPGDPPVHMRPANTYIPMSFSAVPFEPAGPAG